MQRARQTLGILAMKPTAEARGDQKEEVKLNVTQLRVDKMWKPREERIIDIHGDRGKVEDTVLRIGTTGVPHHVLARKALAHPRRRPHRAE
jgi:hypothetical protein